MMSLAISNIAWNKKKDDEIYLLMKKYGFTGIEIAPTKILPTEPYSHADKAAKFAQNLYKEWGFTICSMQSIWYGRAEKLFGSKEERSFLLDYTKDAIDFASAIDCKNLVFGCPKNRTIPDNMDSVTSNEIAIEFFKELGNYALSKNTCIAIEANPTIYGTNFVNTTATAIELIKQVQSDGFKLNLDIGSMIENTEPSQILRENEGLINHVHISEPFLKKIQKRNLHKELMSFFRTANYKGFISVEMGLQEKLSDIEDVMKYICDEVIV